VSNPSGQVVECLALRPVNAPCGRFYRGFRPKERFTCSSVEWANEAAARGEIQILSIDRSASSKKGSVSNG
jgi:hypothetical protein